MPIKVTCEKCGGVLHAPDDAGGKKGRCPNCQNILPIPFDAARAPTFGQPAPAFGAPTPAFNGGAGGPPPGMAFSPAPANPLLPNADAKRPVAPLPFGSGSRPEVGGAPPGLASSTPGIGLNPTFGGQMQAPTGPNMQSSMPFGAPRMNQSAAMPIAPERNGWAVAAAGLRMTQIGYWLIALGVFASCGVLIYGTTAGLALAQKPGFLKWNNFSQLSEIRLGSFLIPATLGILCVVVGRWRFSSMPASSGARGAAHWATVFTFLAAIGFFALFSVTIMGIKDGGVPHLVPKGDVAKATTPIAIRVTTYLQDIFMPEDQIPGIIQRFSLLSIFVFGKMGELFFGCSLGRVGAHVRDTSATSRVTSIYAFFALVAITLVFLVVFNEMFRSKSPADINLNGIANSTLNMIVGGTIIGVVLLTVLLKNFMLGAVRRACGNAAA